jgi:hypothetical protein
VFHHETQYMPEGRFGKRNQEMNRAIDVDAPADPLGSPDVEGRG